MASLREDLEARADETVETHISWVFLCGDEVFKVKKPVDLGFLDFSTRAERLAACEAEVELNRRLAPGVYLGVVPITRGGDGRHQIGGAGEVVDHAVRMVRLAEDRRADVRLAAGELDSEDLEEVAKCLARFHAEARSDAETARFGEVETIAANVVENFEQTRESISRHLSAEEAEEIEGWQRRFLEHRSELFAARVAAGRVRDGHGDLRLEHVYLEESPDDGQPTIVDCIEFNERFRYADVCADVAFLSMDLAWHGRVDLAEGFLAAYAREANDFDLYPLVDFYESYRAYVRGKVAAILAADAGTDAAARERAAREARRYFLLALASERRSLLPPVVVAVGGVIAAGKSTLARHLAAELSAPIVDADRTRKFLVGAEPEEKLHVPAWQGAYSPERTEQVYEELLRRAGAVLASGRPVVLDASFRSAELRAGARALAERHGAPFRFVECRCDPETARARLEQREREGGVSDGRLEIFEDFAAAFEPGDELGGGERAVLDTARPLVASLAELRDLVATWPRGLTR